MAIIGLIIWCITVFVCLCFLFKSPQFISRRVKDYRFSNYSRNLIEKDHKFICAHVQLIDNYRNNQRPPQTFILTAAGYLLLFFALSAILLAVCVWSGEYIIWFADLFGNRPTKSSFLVLPFGGVFTLIVGMFFGLVVIIPALQFWVVKKNKDRVASFLFLARSYYPSEDQSVLTKRTADDLEVLLRQGVIDSHRKYTLDDFIRIGIDEQQKLNRKLVTASTILFLSMLLMSVFNFVKVTNDEIIYSPAYSFAVTIKSVDDVVGAKYICETKDNEHILKLLVELNNGYKFRVRRHEISSMDGILKAVNIPLGEIDAADSKCQNKR